MIRRSLPSRALTLALCVAAALGTLLFWVILAPAPALALSEGRQYELVSPVFKGGYGINGLSAVAPNGESVAFNSLGAFAGDPSNIAPPLGSFYVARRGSAEWSTAPVGPPAVLAPHAFPVDFSLALESSLSEAVLGPNDGTASNEPTEIGYLLHSSDLPDTPEAFTAMGGKALKTLTGKKIALNYEGASPGFSHVVFRSGEGEYLLSEAKNTASTLYDLVSDPGAGEPSLRLVGLDNRKKAIAPGCRDDVGSDGRGDDFNAVADNGEEIFFSTETTAIGACPEHQLFVRIAGSKTLEVSRPLSPGCTEVPCAGAETRAPADFMGANEAGTLVFFTTTAPLVPGSMDTSENLYMARIGCPAGAGECEPAQREVTSLVQVSHDAVGAPAEVQGLVTLAEDGSRVYFVAHGVLSTTPNAEGASPLAGADNLYLYDNASGGPPVFVADLCSGPEASGVVEDLRCPIGLAIGNRGNDANLWTGAVEPEAQTNGCSAGNPACEPGRFLVFSTYAQLTVGDTDNAKDVYRYDAVTGDLERVSLGENGYDANGNGYDREIEEETLIGGKRALKLGDETDATIAGNEGALANYKQRDLNSRAIAEDGSRIVFTSAEPLSPAAENHLANVYEWHEGDVSLISTGSSAQPVEHVVISQTGNDIFFLTAQGLVPQDTDGQSDLYDAHKCSAQAPCFAPAPAEAEPCEGDACQGPLTNPAPLLVPGSISQAPGGNFPPPAPPPAATLAQKKAAPKCAKGRKLSRGACVEAKTKRKQKAKAKKSVHTNRKGQS